MSDKHLEFWLSWNNNTEKIRLPILPAKVSVQAGQNFTDIEVVDLGESTIIGEMQLKEYSFSSTWPERYDPGVCEYEGFPTPDEFLATIERWRATGWPIRFLVTGSKINTAATIRDFSYDWDGFDVDFSITMREYRFITIESTDVNIEFRSISNTFRPDTQQVNVSSTKKGEGKKEKLVDKYLARGKPKL